MFCRPVFSSWLATHGQRSGSSNHAGRRLVTTDHLEPVAGGATPATKATSTMRNPRAEIVHLSRPSLQSLLDRQRRVDDLGPRAVAADLARAIPRRLFATELDGVTAAD